MTDTSTRPLPTDMATLRAHWLPVQPTSSVTAALAGINRLDELAVPAAPASRITTGKRGSVRRRWPSPPSPATTTSTAST